MRPFALQKRKLSPAPNFLILLSVLSVSSANSFSPEAKASPLGSDVQNQRLEAAIQLRDALLGDLREAENLFQPSSNISGNASGNISGNASGNISGGALGGNPGTPAWKRVFEENRLRLRLNGNLQQLSRFLMQELPALWLTANCEESARLEAVLSKESSPSLSPLGTDPVVELPAQKLENLHAALTNAALSLEFLLYPALTPGQFFRETPSDSSQKQTSGHSIRQYSTWIPNECLLIAQSQPRTGGKRAPMLGYFEPLWFEALPKEAMPETLNPKSSGFMRTLRKLWFGFIGFKHSPSELDRCLR